MPLGLIKQFGFTQDPYFSLYPKTLNLTLVLSKYLESQEEILSFCTFTLNNITIKRHNLMIFSQISFDDFGTKDLKTIFSTLGVTYLSAINITISDSHCTDARNYLIFDISLQRQAPAAAFIFNIYLLNCSGFSILDFSNINYLKLYNVSITNCVFKKFPAWEL